MLINVTKANESKSINFAPQALTFLPPSLYANFRGQGPDITRITHANIAGGIT